MNKIKWKGNPDILDNVPEGPGAYFLRDAEMNLLLADCTADMPAQLMELLGPERERTADLRVDTSIIELEPTDDLLSACTAMRRVTSQEPQRTPLHGDQYYLGVRFHEPPYVTISPFTLENYYYAGPFPSRFELHDVLTTLSLLCHTPLCEDKHFPCIHLTEKACPGYCIDSNTPERRDIFFKNLLRPNPLLLDELRESRESRMDDLAFARADLLDKQIHLLDRFYDKLTMLHATHLLSTVIEREGVQLSIERGRMAWVLEHGRSQILHRSVAIEKPLREYLAYEKEEYSERRAVYLALKQEMPSVVAAASEASIQKFGLALKGEDHAD